MLRQKPEPSPPYAGARTTDNRIDPSLATKDRAELRAIPPLRDKATDDPDAYPDEVMMRKGGKVTKVMPAPKAKAKAKSKARGK